MDQRLRRAGLPLRCVGFLLAIAAVWVMPAAATAACDPTRMCCAGGGDGAGDGAGLGSPCGGAGVATLGNASGTDQGVGNPIHVVSGNKHQREVDMPALPGVLGLELVRYYNSAEHGKGVLGRGWRLSYESELRVRGNTVQIVQGDGTRLRFVRVPGRRDTYRTAEPLQGRVRAQAVPGGTAHVWTWAEGRELRFDPQGRLELIRAPSGEFVSLRHDERGWLREVIDPAGRRLVLHYPGHLGAHGGEHGRDPFRGVYAIDTPVGRFTYAHGAALPAGSQANPRDLIASLTSVSAPAAAGQPARVRHYHHEDPRWPVLLTGISEQQGEQAPRRLSTWAYDPQARAVLSFKGERVAGAPGLEQVSLQWLPGRGGQGHTRLTNSLGQTTDYTTARLGGAMRILQVRGAGCAACGPVNVRYGYDRLGRLIEATQLDASGRPVLTLRTERDAQGRVTQRSTLGYRRGQALPAQWRVRYAYAPVDPADPDALPDPQPVRIERPSVVAGRVHTLRLAYNAARQVVRVEESGYSPVDEQGRFVPQGVPIERRTVYTHASVNGRSVRVSRDGPLPNGPLNSPADSDITRYDWDARGDRVVQVTWPGGEVTAVASAPGAAAPLPAPTASGATAHAPIAEADRHGPDVERDLLGRPTAWLDTEGRALLTATWGPAGSVAEWQPLALATPQRRAERRLDDFGRVVAIRNPDQGWQHARYDLAGRVVQVTDPTGAHQQLDRDLAGRVVRIERFAAGALQFEQVVQRRHLEGRLVDASVSDAQGTRRLHITRGARGEVTRETWVIQPAGELQAAIDHTLRFTMAYRRDANGRLTARELTDATGRTLTLAQDLDAEDRPVRMTAPGALPHWLGGQREIVRRIEWQPQGETPWRHATAVFHADGTEDRFEPAVGLATGRHQADVPRMHRLRGEGPPPLPPPGLGHDAAGRPSIVLSERGLQRLRWNAAGQLAQTLREDGSRSRYLRDANGRRVIKLVTAPDGRVTASVMLHDGDRLLAEADAEGRWTHAYVHLGHRPVAQVVLAAQDRWQGLVDWLFGPRVRHLHTARAGRVLSVTEDAQMVWRDEAPAGGRGADVHQPLRDVGQYHDDDSGLDDHGARFFEAREGRFISPDPSGIADAVNGVPASQLLDLHAYAGGQPDLYFDPDGAAKLSYYLIDAEPEEKSAAAVAGRWAFWLRDMAGENAQTQVLYDRGGAFLGSSSNPLAGSDTAFVSATYARWTSTSKTQTDPTLAFVRFYVNDLISPDSFTVDIDDAAALQLLDELQTQGDVVHKYLDTACGAGAAGVLSRQLVLPPVHLRGLMLSPGGVAGLNDAPGGQRVDQGQDTLSCLQGMTPERAFQRLKRAVEIKESGGADCSKTGCPAGTQNPAGTPASYGPTQFVVSTFVDRLLTFSGTRPPSKSTNLASRVLFDSQANMTDEERTQLGFTSEGGTDSGLRRELRRAQQRALAVLGNARILGARNRLPPDAGADLPTTEDVNRFAEATGFSHSSGSSTSEAFLMYRAMTYWAQVVDLMEDYRKRGGGSPEQAYALLHQDSLAQIEKGVTPTSEQRFTELIDALGMTRTGFRPYLRQRIWNEGWQGFATAAIFTDAAIEARMLEEPQALFKSRSKFDLISDREIRWKYAQYRTTQPGETEEDIVARVGYFHNAGQEARTADMARLHGYVQGLIGIWRDKSRIPCADMAVSRFALDPAMSRRK
jgi:RHS repeat-associated protein